VPVIDNEVGGCGLRAKVRGATEESDYQRRILTVAANGLHGLRHVQQMRSVRENMREGQMKVLMAYDGSSYADAALNDLFRAGLPREVEALVVGEGY